MISMVGSDNFPGLEGKIYTAPLRLRMVPLLGCRDVEWEHHLGLYIN